MRNPFQYGSVVRDEAFCNRRREQKDLRRAIENAERLFVYSERRLGKTSLVRQVLASLPARRNVAVYVDLWPTDSAASFATTTARALAQAHARTPKKLLEAARTLFSRLVPSVTVDDQGKPTLKLDLAAREAPKLELEEVLEAPAVMAAETGRRVTVVLDECQRILEYESDLVERALRSVIQHQEDVAYVFLGSRKHLIQKMFLDESRPLYRSAGHYPLSPIEEKDWIPFIASRFHDGGRTIEDAHISRVCELTQGHPFYTQHLCHALWEICETGGEVDEAMIDAALRILLEREGFAYTTLWDTLSRNQRRFLVGLAVEPADVQPFSSAFTRRYGLRSASNAQRAVEGLLEKDVIDREDRSYVITDRFFRLWIQRVPGNR
jgi:AAA+ ATPase superfamily predicted ATPase